MGFRGICWLDGRCEFARMGSGVQITLCSGKLEEQFYASRHDFARMVYEATEFIERLDDEDRDKVVAIERG